MRGRWRVQARGSATVVDLPCSLGEYVALGFLIFHIARLATREDTDDDYRFIVHSCSIDATQHSLEEEKRPYDYPCRG